jgi:hypothetical protein
MCISILLVKKKNVNKSDRLLANQSNLVHHNLCDEQMQDLCIVDVSPEIATLM